MLKQFQNKTQEPPEAPPSLAEYTRRLAEVEELDRRYQEAAVRAGQLEASPGGTDGGVIDGARIVFGSAHGSRVVQAARKATDQAREFAETARGNLNEWAQANHSRIWPPDQWDGDPIGRRDAEAKARRLAQLADDLRELGVIK